MNDVKKTIKKRAHSPNIEMISLLQEIRKELITERKTKLRNALILATAIVLFAVPLNFMVEVAANYLDSSSTGDLVFVNLHSVFYWLFWGCMVVIIFAFITFFRPMVRIFWDSFDWDTVFKDLETEGRKDEYFVDSEKYWYCDACGEEFGSERGIDRHIETCEVAEGMLLDEALATQVPSAEEQDE